jgi:hypothetical protein
MSVMAMLLQLAFTLAKDGHRLSIGSMSAMAMFHQSWSVVRKIVSNQRRIAYYAECGRY